MFSVALEGKKNACREIVKEFKEVMEEGLGEDTQKTGGGKKGERREVMG